MSDARPPLFVDLDGTLLRTDLMLESALTLVRRDILSALLIPVWLLRGRAFLKRQLARRVRLSAERLPVNPAFMRYLEEQRSAGRELILISAADQEAASRVGGETGLFSRVLGSTPAENLKGAAKLARIRELAPEGGFAYAGDARADLPVWRAAAEAILVNGGRALRGRLAGIHPGHLEFDRPAGLGGEFLKAMRPHQWFKNGLLAVPLITAHQVDQWALWLQLLPAFACFSLCSSSAYLLNDLFDLDADRRHARKRRRPFARGGLPLWAGILGAPALLAAAFAGALLLPAPFLPVLAAYWLLTLLYSLLLKRLFLVDVAALAVLYTIRLVAGAAAVAVGVSLWLLGFSLLLFAGLGLVKRVTEIVNAKDRGEPAIAGRAYRPDDRRPLTVLGGLLGAAAVLVFAFYINAPETTRLYSTPALLWLICPLLLFLVGRMWRLALAGRLDEDPVLFALSDATSLGVTAFFGLLLWLAA